MFVLQKHRQQALTLDGSAWGSQVEAKLEFWDASEALLSRAMHIFHTEQPKDAESRQLLIDCTEFYSDEIIAKDKARQKQEDEQEERILNGGVGCAQAPCMQL